MKKPITLKLRDSILSDISSRCPAKLLYFQEKGKGVAGEWLHRFFSIPIIISINTNNIRNG